MSAPVMKIDTSSFGTLDAACRLTVVVPAKNEERAIGPALEALARQNTIDGSSLDPRSYDVLVFCNDCTDGTAAAARSYARLPYAPRIHVIEGTLPPAHAHVGTARQALLDVASERYLVAGRANGIVASTDADSRVDGRWIARTLAAMQTVDAVAGSVEVASEERDQMLAPMRLLYDRERTYRRLLGALEDREDPQAFDPWPRHDAFVGASFAVSASVYRAAGGLRALPRLEDQAFSQQLQRIDARVRHSFDVRVSTSARRIARVDGGFASFMNDLSERGDRRESFPVMAARRSVAIARARAAFRAMRLEHEDGADVARLRAFFALDTRTLRSIARESDTFGEAFERAFELGSPRVYEDEPVESAIVKLRAVLAVRKPWVPTLASTASGAG